MMELLDQFEHLPQLLDFDAPTLRTHQRWYWRRLLRWREYLFRVWQRDSQRDTDEVSIEHGVDDLIGLMLLMEHFRRLGFCDLSSLANMCKSHTRTTIADAATTIVEHTRDPLLAAVLNPDYFASQIFPASMLDQRFERRLADATWLLYHDRPLPLSFFGEFHQLCNGNPLVTQPNDFNGPSTRRALGMFYTPAPIVDYLVWTSLGRLLAETSSSEMGQLRVLDPSCGCGAFLIGCLRFLVLWYERQLGDVDLAKQSSLRCFEHAFRGCDIDSRALQWTTRLLSLAAWDSTRSETCLCNTIVKPVLPDFKSILSCRSFLEPDAESNSDLSETRYDAIIGGPPFVRLEALNRSQKDRLFYYRRRFLSARQGQFDLYMLFIEQALDLLKPGGLLAFSLSNSFLRSEGGRRIRGYIAANAAIEEIVEFDDPRTYTDAATQIALLRLRKTKKICGGRYVLVKGQG